MTVAEVEVEAANAEFYAAFEAADLDRMSAIWLDGRYAADVACVHPGWSLLRGRDEVLRSWALIMANTPYIQFVLTDLHVQLLGDDKAVVTCAENMLTAEEGAPTASPATGTVISTNVFLRADGAWRLLLHHGSPVLSELEEDA